MVNEKHIVEVLNEWATKYQHKERPQKLVDLVIELCLQCYSEGYEDGSDPNYK